MTEQELNNKLSEICNSEEFATSLFALASDYNARKIDKQQFINDFTKLLPEAQSVLAVKFTIKYYNIVEGVASSCQLFYSIICQLFE